MTEFLEYPNNNYVLEPNNLRMEGALEYINMFEITISNWEGKFKLSQDKNTIDIEKARAELIKINQESIKLFLDKILKKT